MMTLLGWKQAQWDEVVEKYHRVTGLIPIVPESIVSAITGGANSIQPYLELQSWWKTLFLTEPTGIPRVEFKESKPMSGQRINFGFDCKIISMGWREDFLRGGQVYELRVRVGDAGFGAQRIVPHYQVTMAYDEGFKQAVEREVHESVKREVVAKLFPNL